ncbi:hypothetical protein ACQCN2_07965 [Brevibacillus ginsengisoli]|uniref:hypothetical protein n=1 Tax=Brevibacillus ginsengisoli TaxID=363854 RepID=UPI003CF40AD6
MVVTFEITSPWKGTVQKVIPQADHYIFEGDVLAVIQNGDGQPVEICSSFSGQLVSLEITEGSVIEPETTLATLEEKLHEICLGSD